MSDIIKGLRQWVCQQPAFVDIMQSLGLEPLLIVWSDDLAIPWATHTAAELPAALQKLMTEIHRCFQAKGFIVNFNKGKTGAVVSFIGKGAPALRREYVLCDTPGLDIPLGPHDHAWLHVTTTYKHLGTVFAASHSFDPELNQRIGMAKATFSQVSRAIVCNRHYPLRLRLQFLQSLIFSRLFFGLGAWTTPSLKQMHRLRVVYQRMLRAVLRSGPHDQLTNREVLVQTHSLDVRVRLAIDRLGYARRLFQVGPAELQQLLHIEKQLCTNSWFDGLAADLQWLQRTLPQAVPDFSTEDFSDIIDCWQADRLPWKSILRRAARRHLKQEEVIDDVHSAHERILARLRRGGAEFDPDVSQLYETSRTDLLWCDCGRSFASPQGLALHRLKAHGIHAPEHAYIQGATCPACLQFLWTSNRLALHLAYIPRHGGPNPCFALLQRAGYHAHFAAATVPATFKSTIRLDALPAAGPLPDFEPAHVRVLQEIAEEIQTIEATLCPSQVPEDPLEVGLRLGETLTAGTRKWIQKYCDKGPDDMPDLIDWWFGCIFSMGDCFEEWATDVFVAWGEHWLPDLVAEALHGEVEYVLDETFAEIVELFPRTATLRKLSALRQRYVRLDAEAALPPLPHRPVRYGTANDNERKACTRFQVAILTILHGRPPFAEWHGLCSRRSMGSLCSHDLERSLACSSCIFFQDVDESKIFIGICSRCQMRWGSTFFCCPWIRRCRLGGETSIIAHHHGSF